MKQLIVGIAALSIGGALAGEAAAGNCRDVKVRIENHFELDGVRVPIRAIDFDYWDPTAAKWRGEAAVPNVVFNPSEVGVAWLTRDLERVLEETTMIRVYFQYLTATSGWSDAFLAYSDARECREGMTVTIQIDPVDGL